MTLGRRSTVIGVVLITLGGFVGFTYQGRETEQSHQLAEQSCHLVGQDRRSVYGILITLAFTPSVPEATRRVLARQASDVFRTLDCTEIDLDVSNVPHVRAP